MTLFPQHKKQLPPLAHRMRPIHLQDMIGQSHLTGSDGLLNLQLQKNTLSSFILWGPPGCGKTTLAQIVAHEAGLPLKAFSAVMSGIKDIKPVMEKASLQFQHEQVPSFIFVDEIHRFNKAQQDAFLPYVESGEIILAGATTENPSFEINAALLSRLKVHVLNELTAEDLLLILERALRNDALINKRVVTKDTLEYISQLYAPDARGGLNALEQCLMYLKKDSDLTVQKCTEILGKRILKHDKSGESHYNIISALHKSIRNSDADASLYWLACMLEGGEDPLYIARRLIRFASEDIGNADPQALHLALAAKEAVYFIGMPEGKLALAQLVVYLSSAPKSNSIYAAYKKVAKDLAQGHVYNVPLHLRNAPTKLMKDLDYGKDYEYAHSSETKTTAMTCLPEELKDRSYYEPIETGHEKALKERLEYYKKLKVDTLSNL